MALKPTTRRLLARRQSHLSEGQGGMASKGSPQRLHHAKLLKQSRSGLGTTTQRIARRV